MKFKNKKILAWTLLIGWMIVIFIYSSQPGEVSSEKSEFVIYIFNLLGIDLNGYFGELSGFIVRKAAHMTEYLILFILSCNLWRLYLKDNKVLYSSFLTAFLYACTDEFHQMFVPGRAGMFRDVMIDSSGALIGLLLIWGLKYKNKIKKGSN